MNQQYLVLSLSLLLSIPLTANTPSSESFNFTEVYRKLHEIKYLLREQEKLENQAYETVVALKQVFDNHPEKACAYLSALRAQIEREPVNPEDDPAYHQQMIYVVDKAHDIFCKGKPCNGPCFERPRIASNKKPLLLLPAKASEPPQERSEQASKK